MTNEERTQRGVITVNTYLDREPAYAPHEAAVDAIADILHAYCTGDEIEAENMLAAARMHFVCECDEERDEEEDGEEF